MKQNVKKIVGISALVLVIAVCVVWILIQQTAPQGNRVQVRISGEVERTVDIDRDDTFEVNGKNDIVLKVVISDSQVYVQHSDCPDKVCVNKGKIHKVGDTIVCLPAETVIEIVENDTK